MATELDQWCLTHITEHDSGMTVMLIEKHVLQLQVCAEQSFRQWEKLILEQT